MADDINPDALYKVKNAVFEYYADGVAVHPITGEESPAVSPRFAFRNQVLEGLRDEDARRGLNRGEIVEVRRKAPTEEATPEETGIVGNNAEEIADWIKANKPSVLFLVEKVGDDAGLASMVLEAENIVTNESPRATLVTALNKVIATGDEDEDEEDEQEDLDEEDES